MSLAELFLNRDDWGWFSNFKYSCKKKGWFCEVVKPEEEDGLAPYPDRVRVFASHIIQGKELLWEAFVMIHTGRELGKEKVFQFLEHEHNYYFAYPELWPPKPDNEGEKECNDSKLEECNR